MRAAPRLRVFERGPEGWQRLLGRPTKRAKNREQAFWRLQDLGLMTYAAAKDSFYRGWREPRFRPIYLEFPELAREMTPGEVAYFQREKMVEPGRTIKRTFDDPQLGRVEFGLTGL